MPRTTLSAAAGEVARRDRVMARLMKRTGPFRLPTPTTGHFAALAESILYQQLAGAAAAAIHRRFVALFDGELSPEAVLALRPKRLRAAGLSGNKAASIRDLAAKVADGTVHSITSAGSLTRKSSHASRSSVASGDGPPRCS